nr:RNA-directed DNA polymerase, eukaryota [Tanacetum cinerariifolium]
MEEGKSRGSLSLQILIRKQDHPSNFFYKQIARKVTSWWNVDYVDANSYEEWLDWLGSLRIPAKLKLMLEGVFYVVWR